MGASASVVNVEAFVQQGYVAVRQLIPAEELVAMRARVEATLSAGSSEHISPRQLQTQHDRSGGVALVKVNQITESDPLFQALSHRTELVDVVETLLGPGARIFRDVLIVKPAHSSGKFSWHQDSAYWDVEPKGLVSAWVALTDVPEEASCLRVIPGSHDRYRRHSLFVRGKEVPTPVVDGLRKLVSYAGTGDNPGAAGGNLALWKAKKLVLANATRYVPDLAALQDFRTVPRDIDEQSSTALTAKAGDVIFFHSLLLHATGPNTSDFARYTPIISYMSKDSRFTGKGTPSFRLARRQPTT
jgi:ectoine hydroxylase-related dioxygenase (phytanoyl-CoA dioxygenase family)